MPQIVSIQVGLPHTYPTGASDDPAGESWTTGFFKQPVAGLVEVGWKNIAGDGQADRRVHGGRDKAVLAYSAEHYPVWEAELESGPLPPGAFGENLTIAGLREANVCLGDLWQAGSVRLEVSQPRQPCWKLGRRWQNKLLPKMVVNTGRSGWYFRVVQVGSMAAGMPIELVERRHPTWSIERANQAMYHESTASELMELASLAELSPAWIKCLPA